MIGYFSGATRNARIPQSQLPGFHGCAETFKGNQVTVQTKKNPVVTLKAYLAPPR